MLQSEKLIPVEALIYERANGVVYARYRDAPHNKIPRWVIGGDPGAVARAQGKSYGLADRLAKMIPFSPEMTLEKALKDNTDLRRTLKVDEDASEIFDMAKKLEGIITKSLSSF